ELITIKTKLIVLTNPHNPTGIALDSEELTKLKQIADAHDLYVMFDEAFIERFGISLAYPR
ncbi:MAG: aminotransferase class I/II-fold pyridoxal phosphate-dependent enzyme, partial [Planctomycetes bacterium]|nr:aminotransferase class I/II-fold pyridoxal phosphate-dependent enzyme [Planctomycetota bacterium]